MIPGKGFKREPRLTGSVTRRKCLSEWTSGALEVSYLLQINSVLIEQLEQHVKISVSSILADGIK